MEGDDDYPLLRCSADLRPILLQSEFAKAARRRSVIDGEPQGSERGGEKLQVRATLDARVSV